MPDNTKTNTFNPFEDRLSRDIRNDLSESIIEVLSSRSLDAAEKAAAHHRQTICPRPMQTISTIGYKLRPGVDTDRPRQ